MQIKILQSMDEVKAADWDRLANPPAHPFNPFLRHGFLSALEKSGSAAADTGWLAQHICLLDAEAMCAAMPLYLKSHSQGEYIFDQSWAHAYEQAGGNYYPKLLSAVPFTPATGRRLLTDNPAYIPPLLEGAKALADKYHVSGLHINFLTADEVPLCEAQNFLIRNDQQFHWHNQDYADFAAFLEVLASRKRKNLRKERRRAVNEDVTIDWLTGDEITEAVWDIFYEFYIDTGIRKWGQPYLTRDFFSLIGDYMRHDILLIMAKRAGRYIAGALNFIGGDTLFGRNWGCIEHHPFLHFELCYYQAIDFAIAHKLQHVEAGAQGGHKLVRGYEPALTYSAHYMCDENFHAAVENFLAKERQIVEHDVETMHDYTPFKKT